MNNPKLQTQNRFCLPWEKDISYQESEQILENTRRSQECFDDLKRLVLRPNPFEGEFGVIDIGNTCVQAVLKTLLSGADFVNTLRGNNTSIFYFLNPSELGLDKTSYYKRLTLVGKILSEYESSHYGGHGAGLSYAGWINDPNSMNIRNCDSTKYFYLRSNMNYEILFNSKKPDTTIKFKNSIEKLIKIHKEKNLFEKGPLEFTVQIGHGWHIPVLGVNEIIGFDNYFNPKRIKILSPEGFFDSDIVKIKDPERFLFPIGRKYFEKTI